MKRFPTIAEVIRTAREQVGISQEGLSIKLGYKNGQFVSNIERELCSIPAKKITLTAKHLRISKDRIITAMLKDEELYLREVTR